MKNPLSPITILLTMGLWSKTTTTRKKNRYRRNGGEEERQTHTQTPTRKKDLGKKMLPVFKVSYHQIIFYILQPRTLSTKREEKLSIPPLLMSVKEMQEEEDDVDPFEGLSEVEHKCPICEYKLNIGQSTEKKKFYVMCSSGECNLGWQPEEASYASDIGLIVTNVLPIFKYPKLCVRSTQHEKVATIIRCSSKVELLKKQAFLCVFQEKGRWGKVRFYSVGQITAKYQRCEKHLGMVYIRFERKEKRQQSCQCGPHLSFTGVSKKCKGQCKQKKEIEMKFLKEKLDEDFLEKSKNNGTSRTWKDFIF